MIVYILPYYCQILPNSDLYIKIFIYLCAEDALNAFESRYSAEICENYRSL